MSNPSRPGVQVKNGSVSRRAFLAVAGPAVLKAGWPGAAAAETKPPAKYKRKWGMVIDLQRCIVCRSCTVACKQENKTPPGMLYNPVLEEEVGEYPKPGLRWFPRPCYHCDKPACLEACPVKAIRKRADNIVYIDPNLCMGIQACVRACPYGVPIFDKGKNYHDGRGEWNEIASPELTLMEKPAKRIFRGKSRKCSFCLHKQDADGNYTDLPACAKTCMGRAIHFGDLNDPDGELQKLLKSRKHIRRLEEKGTEPNVYYLT
jgi:molybdopterin-containing oxidoreductase family iron-sulfur binding subunit